jgi:hypothetical protein
MTTNAPPAWAEALLRLCLPADQAASVSGDLLEEYRDSVAPARGEWRADCWYLAQVGGFVWRDIRWWGLLFGAAFLIRTALDWLQPPASFALRSMVSTSSGVSIVLAAGAVAAFRSRSILYGTLVGASTVLMGGIVSGTGAAALLAVRHDPATIAAIGQSGGLAEVFTLPLLLVLPGLALGTLGGIAGAALARVRATT